MPQERSYLERGAYKIGADRMPNCGVVLVEPQRAPDVLDIRLLIAASVDAHCEHFGLAGPAARARVLLSIAREAREMRAEL